MSNKENIKRILWHEVGHLCARVVIKENHEGTEITHLNIGHINIIDDKAFNWNGEVAFNPPTIIENDSIIALSLISLISGCIFETTYFNEIINDKREINDCFSSNKYHLGNKDHYDYYDIISQILDKYSFRGKKDVVDFLCNFFKEVSKSLILKKEFIEELDVIIDEEAETINQDFELPREESFEFIYEGDNLKNLIEKVKEVMEKYNYSESINNLKDIFITQLEVFKKKYPNETL